MHNISLTKEQLKSLIELAYLGNWVANATRAGKKDDEFIESYERLEQYIFEAARSAGGEGFSDMLQYSEEMKRILPTIKLEDDMGRHIDSYDDFTFWEILIDKLAHRDMLKKYGEAATKGMSDIEMIALEAPFLQKWESEIDRHGIKRLSAPETSTGVPSPY